MPRSSRDSWKLSLAKNSFFDDLTTLPLMITGHSTVGEADGIGCMTVDHDDRAAPTSRLQQLTSRSPFPASQEMYVNIRVTIEALPGVTLRNATTGVLRCGEQMAF